MPLYEYKCLKCGRRTEKIETVAGPHLKKCPHCGGKVEPMISAPAIQFKGSGWYVTDYAGKTAAREKGAKDEKSASDKSSSEKASGEDKKDTSAKDSTTKDKDSGTKESSSSEKKTEKTAKKK